jgi:D-alanine--poly(phosphoribitol) ligase subunit 1
MCTNISDLDNKSFLAGDLGSLAISSEQVNTARKRAVTRPRSINTTETLVGAVARHAASTPTARAVQSGHSVLTYAGLLSRIRQIQAYFVSAGCVPGDLVAVAGSRSADTIAIFLALEGLGLVYLPLDEQWPSDRINRILSKCRPALVLFHSGTKQQANINLDISWTSITLIRPAAVDSRQPSESVDSHQPSESGPEVRMTCPGEELRYVIYTSGSTGIPKGAMVEHQGMVNHLWSKVIDLNIDRSDVVGFTAPVIFDISIWQMLAPLLAGAAIAVIDDREIRFPNRLAHAVKKYGLTVAEFVPTVIDWLLSASTGEEGEYNLRWLISTGEELQPELAERVHARLPGVRLLNAYGPTECSDDVTHYEVGRTEITSPRIPVGRPVINAALYVLVEEHAGWRAADLGEVGELFIGGIPVGPGYLGDPVQTAEAYYRDPFEQSSPTGRIYRTGDIALIDEGLLYFHGRLDRQVKVGGVRMELGEIEAALSRHPAVRRCAVEVDYSVEQHELVGCYVAESGPIEGRELIAALMGSLPEAFVPRRYMLFDALPLTPNGKIDHATLQFAISQRRSSTEQVNSSSDHPRDAM